jgi:class 3 adenylate cyclase
MGYNGRVDKSKRSKAIVVDEASRVVQTGFEMLQIIEDLKVAAANGRDVREVLEPGATVEHGRGFDSDIISRAKTIQNINMRVGVHTGRVVAGIIGSKLVRYDIFGEGVIIAQQTNKQGVPGKVCVSVETQKTLMELPEVAAEYSFEEYKSVNVPELKTQVPAFLIEQRQMDSFVDSEGQEHSSYGR